MRKRELIVRYVVIAMEGRGRMSNQTIYDAVKEQYIRFKRPMVLNWKHQIRETLQAHCRSCPEYSRRGAGDYFVRHGRGYWSCKVTAAAIFP